MVQELQKLEGRILIVEDDSEFVKVIQRFLKMYSNEFVVHAAPTGEEALKYLQGAPYDLVIIDYTLAGRANGLYVWEFCRKKHPNVPILMMSGLPVEQFLEMMNGHRTIPRFLSKPFQRADLQRVIVETFRSKSNESQRNQKRAA